MKRKHRLVLFGLATVIISVVCITLINSDETPQNRQDTTEKQASTQAQDAIQAEVPTQEEATKTQFAYSNEGNTPPVVLDNSTDDGLDIDALLEDLKVPYSVFDEMDFPIKNNLPDVSNLETSFEEVVSLKPFLDQNISKITYDCEVTNLSRKVENGQILAYEDSFDDRFFMSNIGKIFCFVKQLSFEQSSGTDEIRYVETIEPKNADDSLKIFGKQKLESHRILHVDGRYTENVDNFVKKYCREIDPVFPPSPLTKGSTWTQRISADPKLNPDGKIEAQLCVESTFVKDGEKYIRLRRHFFFKTYRPPISVGAVKESGGEQEYIIHYRLDEIFDLNVNTGVVTDKNTVTQIFFDGYGSRSVGVFSEMRCRETLSSISKKNRLSSL